MNRILPDSKIFVAGGTGMVGSAIIRNLQSKGYTNIVSNYHSREPSVQDVSWQQLDVTDQQNVTDFFTAHKPEVVFLAAAKVGGILANDTYRGDFIYQNLMIQTNVLHQASLHGVQRLLFLGSSCIYPKHAPQPMKEEHLMTGPLEPTNSPYAVAKIAGVEMCDAYNRQYGTSYLPVMPTNLYGPYDNFDLETSHVLPALIRKLHIGRCLETGNWEELRNDLNVRPIGPVDGSKPEHEILDALDGHGISVPEKAVNPTTSNSLPATVHLWGTGNPKREFLHVDDLAEACQFLLFHTSESQLTNIGAGQDLSIKELADFVRDIVGFEGSVLFDPDKPDGTPRKLLDVRRLNDLGWKAKVSLKDGIQSTFRWYRNSIC